MKRTVLGALLIGALAIAPEAGAIVWTFDSGTEGWGSPSPGVTNLRAEGGALVWDYTAAGDPYVFSPGSLTVTTSDRRWMVADIEYLPNSGQAGEFQLFFNVGGTPAWQPGDSFKYWVRPGRRIYIVHIPQRLDEQGKPGEWLGNTCVQIRFDSGDGAMVTAGGTCKLHHLGILGTPYSPLDWTYSSWGHKSGWSALNDIANLSSNNDWLTATFDDGGDGFDPYMQVSPLYFDADTYKYVRLRYNPNGKTNNGTNQAQFFGFPGVGGSGYLYKNWTLFPNVGAQTTIVDMSQGTNNASWTGVGTITTFRIDPLTADYSLWAGGSIAYDRVRITNSPADAGPYAWDFASASSGPGTWRAPLHGSFAGSTVNISGGQATVTGSGIPAMANFDLAMDAGTYRWLAMDLDLQTSDASAVQVQVFASKDGASFGAFRQDYNIASNIGMNTYVYDLASAPEDGSWDGYPDGLMMAFNNGNFTQALVDNVRILQTPPPYIANINDAVVERTDTYSVTPTLLAGSGVSWTKLAGPAWLSVNSSSGVTSGTAAYSAGAPETVTIQASNAQGADQESWTVTVQDTVDPVPALSGDTSLTSGTKQVTFDFGENVFGFGEGDIDVVNGSVVGGSLTAQAGTETWTVDIQGDGSGVAGTDAVTVEVSLAAGVVTDVAGNPNTASGTFSYLFDDEGPEATCSVAPAQENPTNDSTVTFRVEFTEPVAASSFTASDVSVLKNGVSTGLHALTDLGTGQSWEVEVPFVTGDGDLRIRVNTGVCTDLIGNLLAVGDTSARLYVDNTDPTLQSITTSTSSPTSDSSVFFTMTFADNNGEVVNFNGADDIQPSTSGTVATGGVDVTGGPLSYGVELQNVTGDGFLSIQMKPGTDVTDLAGNPVTPNTISSSSIEIDNTPPEADTITPSDTGPTNADSITFTIQFSEPLFNTFAQQNDLVIVHNGTADSGVSFTEVAPDEYEVDVNGLVGNGWFTLAVSTLSDVQDLAGNILSASVTSAPVYIDNTPPNVSAVTPATTGPTNADNIDFTVLFDEDVANFDGAADVTVTHTGTASTGVTVAPVTDDEYTVTVQGVSGDGSFTLGVNTGTGVTDTAGNPLAGTQTSAAVDVDNTAPSVTVNQNPGQADPAETFPVVFDAEFDEPVGLFAGGAVQNGGNAPGVSFTVSGSGATYSIEATAASGDGSISPYVPAGVTTDAAGNPNEASVNGADNFVEVYPGGFPPVVVTLDSPAYVEKDEGEPATLSVAATGGVAPLQYQWYYEDPGTKAYAPISGAEAAGYTIDPLTLDDAGNYQCQVTDGYDTTMSPVIELVVNEVVIPPVVVNLAVPDFIEKNAGESATFEVAASGGAAPLQYQWYYEDPVAKLFDPIPGANNTSYTIGYVQLGDAGNYRCEVTDGFETGLSPVIELAVNESGLPAAGGAGLGALLALTALGGAWALRRRR